MNLFTTVYTEIHCKSVLYSKFSLDLRTFLMMLSSPNVHVLLSSWGPYDRQHWTWSGDLQPLAVPVPATPVLFCRGYCCACVLRGSQPPRV